MKKKDIWIMKWTRTVQCNRSLSSVDQKRNGLKVPPTSLIFEVKTVWIGVFLSLVLVELLDTGAQCDNNSQLVSHG